MHADKSDAAAREGDLMMTEEAVSSDSDSCG